jgi:hypothetical protein
MVTGLITLAGTLVAGLFWWMKWRAARAADPVQQNRNRYEQIDADISRGNSLAATEHATADLDELERLQLGKGH